MSGPKVVRIVTREEILEICRGHLARVDAALAEWTRIGKRHDCIDQEALAAAQQRRDTLAALIEAERFEDLQKQAPIEESFLRRDAQSRLAKLAEEQAQSKMRERRSREAGVSLLRSLRGAGVQIDGQLESGILAGDATSLSEGFRLMADRASSAPGASSGLAAGLREEGSTQSFASWLEAQAVSQPDQAIVRIERRLAELEQMLDVDAVAQMRARLTEAETAPPARRSLLLDGLEVESGRRLDEARRREALVVELQLITAECRAAGIQVDKEAGGDTSLTVEALEARLTAQRGALEVGRAVAAAELRRAVVLEGLKSLGYQVAEGMSTATPEDGRLVVRSSARPDYGVEIVTAGASGKMQMRPVAFDSGGGGPDPARDKDAETIWCGDVSRLQEQLAKAGGGLSIEKALPVGTVALKRVELTIAEQAVDFAAPARRERSRPL